MTAQDLNLADDAAPIAEFERRPKAGMVIGLLAGAALIISYLFAYCVINALAASDVIARWKPDSDPRPKYFAVAFVVLATAFTGVSFVARAASKRQMKKFEDMENAPDEVTSSTQF
jgi:hypothetical protein